jgi:integrase
MTIVHIANDRAASRSDSYAEFVNRAKHLISSMGLKWKIPLDSDGRPVEGFDWDLRTLTNSHARNASRTNGFAVHAAMRDAAVAAGFSTASVPQGKVLSVEVQDFIKAVIVERCRTGHLPRSTRDFALFIRKLFSTTNRAPWELSTEELDRFTDLRPTYRKAVGHAYSLAALMNKNLLSINGPLEPQRGSDPRFQFSTTLDERKNGEKLPQKEALYELARIVFQETPRSHFDCIRFCVVRLLILTGLRLNEVLMLVNNCLRWESHIDVVTGKPAGEVGGISRSLQLCYFAEKRKEGAPDLLVEERQWVPEQFQEEVVKALEMASQATADLRVVLRSQARSRESFPKSDLRHFKTSSGEALETADLLFLVISGARGPLPSVIAKGESIGPISLSAFYLGLRSYRERDETLFERYGRSASVRSLSLTPHSLRHLMNTELFRLEVADTVITLHFGRRSVQQSHGYDHRKLSERLAYVRIPDEMSDIIQPNSTQELVAKLIVGGLAEESQMARTFRAMQASQGDRAAFLYLAANADGFHVTPYGLCLNSFWLNPCARHLKCFDGCKHFVASGLQEHIIRLTDLRPKLVAMKEAAAAKVATSMGRKNQIDHAEKLIAGVNAALSTAPGCSVFPLGVDYSASDGDIFS